MLEIRNLAAGYGPVQILWDIDLKVGDGEVVALIGSNGAGKTTLLRAVSGVISPSDGMVRFDGEDITGLAPEQVVRRGVVHVPEGRRLFAGLTVRENLLSGTFSRRETESISDDLDRVLTIFPRLGERLNQLAGRLSGGEQQMCALGRALMAQPRLLMVDELSLGLAPNLAEQLLAQLVDIAKGGPSVLVVEQDVDAALETAARGYVMETGRIVTQGPSQKLAADPKIREAYLGIAPMAKSRQRK